MKKILTAAFVTLLLLAPGCACGRNAETGVSIESYVQTLQKVKSNLEADVLPGYTEALERGDLVPELKKARLGVVQDTLTLIDAALMGEIAGETAETGGE
jgi:hypothetical protein